jgi:hypothetical protein
MTPETSGEAKSQREGKKIQDTEFDYNEHLMDLEFLCYFFTVLLAHD